jgi:hypothetical protein
MNSIKLDRSKLLGFKILPAKTGCGSETASKIGSKVGGKGPPVPPPLPLPDVSRD